MMQAFPMAIRQCCRGNSTALIFPGAVAGIAIARGLYRVHDIIVLDEPTAAIDPLEESRIYKKFVEISKGKTSIIVTHRLGSTKIADRVIVMDKGKIAAIGSHDELMNDCELYRTMFNSQAEWYSERENGAWHVT